MDQNRSAYLFQQYIDKTCSPSELQEFMDIVKNSDDANVLDIILDNFWNSSEVMEINKTKAEMILDNVFSSDKKPEIRRPNLTLKWLGWAAAIFIISIATLLINRRDNEEAVLVDHELDAVPSVQTSESITTRTSNEHQKITLPDGSTVILNNNSTITYTKLFGEKRIVTLDGEGYFDIKHDDKKRFTVYTGKIKTTVLGTAFNIKAYNTDKNIVVTVTRGKVSVLSGNATIGILTPNQQIVFNKDYKKSNLTKVLAKSIVQWQESDLFFDDISMEEAAQLLSKKFNTLITFSNDQAKKCRFTATFLKGESLDEILKIICSYNNAQYQTNANGITIKGEGCQ